MQIIALYDGTCSLCKETKRIFEKFDWLGKVKWISLQEYEKSEQPLVFDKADLRRELHIIAPGGRVLKGFYAVRFLLMKLPLFVIPGLLLHIPFASIIGKPIYKWIAGNRHKFLRKKCQDGSCTL